MDKNIIDKIRNSGKYLEVSRQEIMEQMIKFYNIKDENNMKQMFEEYKNWEIRVMDGKRNLEETIQLAKNNFDIVARIADGYIESGDRISAAIRITRIPKSISGEVSNFYRKSIDYNPLDPNMN